ncbi:MAG: hypothetical protein LBG72_03180 [Spirochaetaceae bacterium]|jgi:hypothetical protein|nr:hypothetical protein [Spirochaetaceae bacterium]
MRGRLRIWAALAAFLAACGVDGDGASNPELKIPAQEIWKSTFIEDFRLDKQITNVAYGNGRFVAVGGLGRIAYSEDGENWTFIKERAFGKEWRIDNGAQFGNWDLGYADIHQLIFTGDMFIAGGALGKMARSADGIAWGGFSPFRANALEGTMRDRVEALCYDKDGGFASVALMGVGMFAQSWGVQTVNSKDGEQWYLNWHLPMGSAVHKSIIFLPVENYDEWVPNELYGAVKGIFICFGNQGGGVAVNFSVDGAFWFDKGKWDAGPVPLSQKDNNPEDLWPFDGPYATPPYPVKANEEILLLRQKATNGSVTLAYDIDRKLYASTTGYAESEWVERNLGQGIEKIFSLIYDGQNFYIAGRNTEGGSVIAYSRDGDVWTSYPVPFDINSEFGITNAAFGGDTFEGINIASNGSKLVSKEGSSLYFSADKGNSWTKVKDSGFSGQTPADIIFGGGQFVTAGGNGVICVSKDGITWEKVPSPFENTAITSLAYGNGIYLAAGGGKAATSGDGKNWTLFTNAVLAEVLTSPRLGFGDGRFIAVEGGGKIAVSSNARDWTRLPDVGGGAPVSTRPVAANGCIAVGITKPKYSAVRYWDGTEWKTSGVFTIMSIVDMKYINGDFAAIVEDGGVFLSRDGMNWQTYNLVGVRIGSIYNSIEYGNGYYAQCFQKGIISYTQDIRAPLDKWVEVDAGTSRHDESVLNAFGRYDPVGIAYGNGRFVIIDSSGAVGYTE